MILYVLLVVIADSGFLKTSLDAEVSVYKSAERCYQVKAELDKDLEGEYDFFKVLCKRKELH